MDSAPRRRDEYEHAQQEDERYSGEDEERRCAAPIQPVANKHGYDAKGERQREGCYARPMTNRIHVRARRGNATRDDDAEANQTSPGDSVLNPSENVHGPQGREVRP